jgi:hypothetical protein
MSRRAIEAAAKSPPGFSAVAIGSPRSRIPPMHTENRRRPQGHDGSGCARRLRWARRTAPSTQDGVSGLGTQPLMKRTSTPLTIG